MSIVYYNLINYTGNIVLLTKHSVKLAAIFFEKCFLSKRSTLINKYVIQRQCVVVIFFSEFNRFVELL